MNNKRKLTYKASSKRSESLPAKIFRIFLEIVRIVLGLVFTFSGFVKAIDPLGFTYKIQDYLIAFGGRFEHFVHLALPAAIALSTFELVLGLCFLLKIKLKITSVLSLIFMGIMLPLTFYLALKNPVTDCGCFGDAIVITNWETFFKNVILTALIILLLVFYKRLRVIFLPVVEWILALSFIVLGVGLSVYSYRHLPMIDFLPYKVGVNIPEAMKIPAGAPADKYDTKLIYQKEGVKKEFTLNNYPKDSTWQFVEQKSTLLSKGYQPPIHNFTIVNRAGNDITDYLIHYKGTVNLMIMYDLTKTSEEGARKAEEFYQQVKRAGTPFYGLTSSPDDVVDDFKQKTGITFPFCKTDPITLKTIVRGNPGLMIINNGTIIGKWNWRDF